MYAPQYQSFLDSLQGQTPKCKLFHYFNLFDDKNRLDLAKAVSYYFYQLAIENKLIGCYNKITNLLSIYCAGTSSREPGEYNNLRKDVQSSYYKQMNNLKKQIQQVKNTQGDRGLTNLYFQIAKTALKYGQYEEAEQHLRKIRDLRVMPEEQFYPMLLKANILSKKIQRSAAVVLPNLDKKKMETPQLIEFFIGQGLREVFEGKANFFTGLLTINPTISQLEGNEFSTPQAIGDIYSILIVANGNRKLVSPNVNFSSRYEQLYLNYQYNQFLTKANEVLQKYRYNPFVENRIQQVKVKLKKVLLFQVLNAYKVVKIQTVVNILGYSQKDIQSIIAQNRKVPSGCSQYQIYPIQRTIILMEEGNPIIQYLQQVNKGLEQRQIKILHDHMNKATRNEMKSIGSSFGGFGGFGGRDHHEFDMFGGGKSRGMGGFGRYGGGLGSMGGRSGMDRMF